MRMLPQQGRAHYLGRAVRHFDGIAHREVFPARWVAHLGTVPVARSDGSSASSFIDRIGPHGMSCLLRISMASNLVLARVHCSMRAKIWLSRGSRALSVA